MDPFVLLKYAALAYAVYFLVRIFYDAFTNLSFISFIWKRVRPKMVAEVLGVLTLVASSFVLLSLFVPLSRLGWMNFFSPEGGNIILTPIADLVQTQADYLRYAPIFLLVSLVFVAPFFVAIEEGMFRHGHTTWGEIFAWSTFFGLIHLILGIPIAAGVSLIILGLFLGYKYRKAYLETLPFCKEEELHLAHARALAWSITYHTLFDTILFIILLGGVIYSLV